MSLWVLVTLVATAWLFYPIVGAFGVAAAVAEGSRPQGAGFSFLPEVLIFPPLFLGLALLIDYFAWPWGRWIIGSICIAMMAVGLVSCVRSALVIHRFKNAK
jgi:hypothetical protein